MPRVKLDYVVSFSNEDPENQASNLLSWEVAKRRWLCGRGEPSASVVLQLSRSVQISSLQIGVYHAALVEVLVGRSETPNDQFQVLVPSSVFLTPKESRSDDAVDKVRSFDSSALAGEAAGQRWDRVRLVCSQPYNKHCKYGISFIHIFEPEGAAPAPADPDPDPKHTSRPRVDTSSDEDEFRPGELFAQHRRSHAADPAPASPASPAVPDTGAQIRQATSHALRNIPDCGTRLVKTARPDHRRRPDVRGEDDRHILHTGTDKEGRTNTDTLKQTEDRNKPDKMKERNEVDRRERGDRSKRDGRDRNGASGSREDTRKRLRPQTDASSEPGPGPECEAPLAGVVFVLSGYENPRRARLRDLAVSLGARPARDWGPHCTHLICAFPGTPKMRAARAAGGAAGPGGEVPVSTAAWVEECGRRGRLLPWRWFATEPRDRRDPPPESPPDLPPAAPPVDDSECDTDDEIEKVLRQQKRARVSSPSPRALSPAAPPGGGEGSADVEASMMDETTQDKLILDESADAGAGATPALPALFAGRVFVVEARRTRPCDARLLARYCRAYGGLVLTSAEAEPECESYILLCGADADSDVPPPGAARCVRVRADWVWACHDTQMLCPLDEYLL